MGVRFPPFAIVCGAYFLPKKELNIRLKDSLPSYGNTLRRTVVAFYSILMLISVPWIYFRGQTLIFSQAHSSWNLLVLQWVGSFFIGAGFGVLLVILTQLLQFKFKSIRLLHNEFHHLISFKSKKDLFLLAMCSSLGEELFFRGAILKECLHWMNGRWGTGLAIFISSLLFSLIHIAPGRRFLAWTASSFVLGVFLAVLYLQIDDLWVVISLHFTVNWYNLRNITKQPVDV